MKRILLTLTLGIFLVSCSNTKEENTITVDKMKVPYMIVEQSIDLDDSNSLNLYLQNGFSPNYINSNGETLLMEIVKNNSLRSLEVLLSYDVDIEEETVIKLRENTNFYEPVKRAVDFIKSKKALDILIDAGADINYKDNLGTPLIIKFIKNKPDSYSEELIRRGVNLNVIDSTGATPLMWAVSKRNHEIIKLLIKNNADLNIVDNRGNPPIYYAYDEETINLLLSGKIDLNEKNKDGENILGEVYLRAISNSYESTVKKLIDLGVDRNYSSYGDTPLKIAEENKDEQMIRLLKRLNIKK